MDSKQISTYTLRIEHLYIAYISSMTCLVRTDYNFVFACLGLYFTLTRFQDKDLFALIYQVNIFLMIMDFIWLCSVGGPWTEEAQSSYNSESWNAQIGIHVFAIIFSVIDCFIKMFIIYYAYSISKSNETQSLIGKQQINQIQNQQTGIN